MTDFTLAAHSGLGADAVEAYAVMSASEARTIRDAGGVILPGYTVAARLEELVPVYPSDEAIAPCGIRGTFNSKVLVRGMPLWMPDEWSLTLLRLVEETNYTTPPAALVNVVDGIMATAGRSGAAS